MAELPLAPLDKIMRKAGAVRVSENARLVLRDVVENYAEKLSRRAADFAKHAGRKTVLEEDVKLAVRGV